jgi:large subunit ribosomal protein L4
MLKIEVKNLSGEKTAELKLDPAVFGVKLNTVLLHQVYLAQRSNQRQATAHTKTRAERTGSTAKPWKQKGTGRARTGSVKNPIWRKGGVTFGPRNERNFQQKINKKVKQLAMKMTLSGKVQDSELIVVDKFILKEKKTKVMAEALKQLGINRKTLMAFTEKDKGLIRFSRNIPKIQNIQVDNLNVLDLLNNKFLLVSKDGVKQLEKKYKGTVPKVTPS